MTKDSLRSSETDVVRFRITFIEVSEKMFYEMKDRGFTSASRNRVILDCSPTLQKPFLLIGKMAKIAKKLKLKILKN